MDFSCAWYENKKNAIDVLNSDDKKLSPSGRKNAMMHEGVMATSVASVLWSKALIWHC